MKYVVYENGKPANTETLRRMYPELYKKENGPYDWDNNRFDSLEEAKEYVQDWCWGAINVDPKLLVVNQIIELGALTIEIRAEETQLNWIEAKK